MKKIFRVLAVLVAVFSLGITQVQHINAQSNALAITPRKDYTLKPGESVTDTLTITNQDPTNPLNLSLSIIDFSAQDESGTPSLQLDENASNTPWSIRDFVTLPDQITIEAGKTVNVPVTIQVPADSGAGSYYSAIQYSSITDQEQNRVNISASSVTLMFVKVPGTAKQQLTFEQFGTFVPDANGISGTFAGLFFNSRPKVMAYRLKNDGNIAEQPNASIVIKNSFGKEVYVVANANPKNQLALRGQTRRFESCIIPETVEQKAANGTEVKSVVCGDTNFSPGRYTAQLSVLYGENGNETREITASSTFWYLPWWFVGLAVAGIAVIIGIMVLIVRRVQDYGARKTRKRR
jgi:hypothetical protein